MREILNFLHCRSCFNKNARPQMLEVGITKKGIQVWCKRCEMAVCHLTAEEIGVLVKSTHDGKCVCELCRV